MRKLGGLIRGPELRPGFRGLRSTGARKISEIGLPREVLRLAREFSHGLQGSWSLGFLLSSAVYGLFYNYLGWRGMLWVGILPALTVVY